LPIDYFALCGPDLYAILDEAAARCAWRAPEDSIVRLTDALDNAALGGLLT